MGDLFGSGDFNTNTNESQMARDLSRIQAKIARDAFQSTKPLRRKFLRHTLRDLEGIRSGPVRRSDVEQNPLYRVTRRGIGQQFNNARENIIANLPAGGVLYDTLSGNERSRAAAQSANIADLAQREQFRREQILANAGRVAMGAPPTAMSGLSGAAANLAALGGNQAAMASAAATQAGAKAEAAGTATGAYLGKGAGGGTGGKP